MRKFNKVVILRTDRIGEVLLSTVAIDAVRKSYPGCRVSFVTSAYSAPLLDRRKDVEEVIRYDTMEKGRGAAGVIKLALKLRSGGYDAAMVLNPHKDLHLACFLAGIPVRAGYDRKWGFLMNRRLKDERDRGVKHEIEYTMDVMSLVGAGEFPAEPPVLFSSDRERDAVLSRLRDIGKVSGKGFIAVHPGSSNPAKAWPREMYAEAIKNMKSRYGQEMDIFIIGTRKETPLAMEITDLSGGAASDLTGMFSLRELIAFLSLCRLFIGNDTGPTHMAAALGVPVIAIFGRNISGVSPERWGPLGKNNIVLHGNPGCDPCYDTTCPYGYKCLRKTEPSDVAGAADKILTGAYRITR